MNGDAGGVKVFTCPNVVQPYHHGELGAYCSICKGKGVFADRRKSDRRTPTPAIRVAAEKAIKMLEPYTEDEVHGEDCGYTDDNDEIQCDCHVKDVKGIISLLRTALSGTGGKFYSR